MGGEDCFYYYIITTLLRKGHHQSEFFLRGGGGGYIGGAGPEWSVVLARIMLYNGVRYDKVGLLMELSL